MEFENHLLKCMPKEMIDSLMSSLSDEDTHAVLLNTNFITDEDFLLEFPNVKPHPIVKHAYIYDKNEYQLGKHLYHELGYYYLQDPAAMIVSSLLNYNDNEIILDMCAAPGGKSVQASLLSKNSTIISNDISFSRASLITNNAERLGLSNLIISCNDFSKNYLKFLTTFDKIILDAPCSGSGMFRKDSKMLDDWSINKVLKFSEIQKELILMAYDMLKPGGIISYSTCSYSYEEDEEVIHYLLNNRDAEILSLPEIGYINQNDPIGVRLLPNIFYGEGQYICQIKKPGILKANKFSAPSKIIKNLPIQFGDKDIKIFGNTYFALDNSFNFKDLTLLRYGVKVGEMNKNIFRYDIHFARSLAKDYLPNISLSLDEVKRYIYGDVINKESSFKGYILLTYNNSPVDIAKTDGQVIKNYYPKGLRKKI